MARGFGATQGVASTDLITTALSSGAVQKTWATWLYFVGPGGGNVGRIFAKNDAVCVEDLLWDSGASHFTFFRTWSGALAQWTYAPTFSANVWHHVMVTYDGGAVGNVPVFFLDGAAGVNMTVVTAASGSLTSAAGAPMLLGNRTDGTRVLDGRLADFANWNALLTVTDAAALFAGGRAQDVHAGNLLEWLPMNENTVHSKVLADPTVTGTKPQDDPGPLHWQLLTLQPMLAS